ncbi:MAG TPA: hypothetical protein VEA16_10980 [Vicinamibacterales bacterium]|nr:hypothetical protein [Vicinamibacterales bacterium]
MDDPKTRFRPSADDVADDDTPVTKVTKVTKPVAVAEPAPAPAIDMTALAQLLATAIQQGTAGAIEQTKPKVHSREEYEFEKKSAFNPEGELHRPRPGLKVPMFWGVLAEEDNKPPIPLYEIESAQTTYDEQILLNQIGPSRGEIEINDGTRQPYEVYVQTDRVTKQPTKLVIGLPKALYEKQNRNQLPPLKRLAKELSAA